MFDFVFTFQSFLDGLITDLLALIPYDPLSGTYYDWITSVMARYGVYVLFILLTIILIWFSLGIFKTAYYFFKTIL